ncbi:MFS general substrate transporter [Backusella circina FSU 941]|nr:MFS general substrate transporter [Backusella circina FSU 941]
MSSLEQEATTSESTPLLRDNEDTSNVKEESFKDLKGSFKPLMASFYIAIVAGLNDGSLGAIIPRVKEYYNISNETISLLFLCSALGFFASASVNGTLVHHLGQYRVLVLGSSTVLGAYTFIMFGLPFPLMGLAMVFVGAGMAVLDAGMNVYTANLPLATLLLNTLHAVYGVGAMLSPLVATFLLERDISWKGIYVFLTAVCVINIISIVTCFRKVDFEVPEEESPDGTTKPNHSELTKAAIFNRMTLIGAAYILVYVGVEVTLGGWGYTFLTEGRHGDHIAMEKVVSGFWAGLASGRLLLGYLAGRFGEKLMITLFTVLVLFGLIAMITSSDIVLNSTVFISFGLLLGPLFPVTVSLASKVLPRSYHATSIGFIAALGSGGAALFPFITGQIAGKFGIISMPTVCLVMTSVMIVLWAFVPSNKPFFAACK